MPPPLTPPSLACSFPLYRVNLLKMKKQRFRILECRPNSSWGRVGNSRRGFSRVELMARASERRCGGIFDISGIPVRWPRRMRKRKKEGAPFTSHPSADRLSPFGMGHVEPGNCYFLHKSSKFLTSNIAQFIVLDTLLLGLVSYQNKIPNSG